MALQAQTLPGLSRGQIIYFAVIKMADLTTKKLYIPLLLWLVALATLYNSRPISATRRHRAPSVMDPCPTTCQFKTLIPCLQKCNDENKPPTDKYIICQQECQKKFHKCIDDCHKRINKENKKLRN
ncbi:hypothetical protein ACROYT_G035353 [Oculina patagonica]